MAKLFVPSEFSPEARQRAVTRLEHAAILLEQVTAEYSDARKDLQADAGSEGIAFPFFQREIGEIAEIREDLEIFIHYWTPQEKS